MGTKTHTLQHSNEVAVHQNRDTETGLRPPQLQGNDGAAAPWTWALRPHLQQPL